MHMPCEELKRRHLGAGPADPEGSAFPKASITIIRSAQVRAYDDRALC